MILLDSENHKRDCFEPSCCGAFIEAADTSVTVEVDRELKLLLFLLAVLLVGEKDDF